MAIGDTAEAAVTTLRDDIVPPPKALNERLTLTVDASWGSTGLLFGRSRQPSRLCTAGAPLLPLPAGGEAESCRIMYENCWCTLPNILLLLLPFASHRSNHGVLETTVIPTSLEDMYRHRR